MELKGKTALITGSCGEGMGRSTALRLARNGANIVLNYGTHRRGARMEAAAKKIARAVEELGGHAIIQEADTADERQVRAMVRAAERKFGRVDILVNNAGGGWNVRDYTEIPLNEWKQVLADEIDGAFLLMKHSVPGMRRRKWGRIIHIALNGVLQTESLEGLAPDYCMGKAARAWMTTAFGLQESARGITVNCIEPPTTPYPTFEEAVKAARGEWSQWRKRKAANSHDIAEIVAFLCSEAGRFVSGSTVRLPQA
jgi:3-oxoacyl-[acyl-carrier protein] reductase